MRVRLLVLSLIALLCVAHVFAHEGHDDMPTSPPSYAGSVQVEGGLVLSWTIVGEKATFHARAPAQGWLCIGFSRETYGLVDMLVGYANGTVLYMGSNYRGAPADFYEKNIADLHDPEAELKDKTTMVLSFSRKADTGSLSDVVISDGVLLHWAWGNTTSSLVLQDMMAQMANHTLQLTFTQPKKAEKTVNQIQYHGALMLTLVMVVMTSQIITSRYLKHLVSWWFYLHAALALLGLVIFSVSLSIIFSAHHHKFISSWHSVFGIIFIILMCLQNLMGIFSHLAFDKHRRSVPLFPDKIHWWLGRILYIHGLITIGLGLGMWGVSAGGWMFYALWWVVICVVFAVLDNQLGQTHEHVVSNKHKALEQKEDSTEKGSLPSPRRSSHNASTEYLVMLFVPIVTIMMATYAGVALSL